MTLQHFFIGLDVVLLFALLCFLWLAIQDFFRLKEIEKQKESERLIEMTFFGGKNEDPAKPPALKK